METRPGAVWGGVCRGLWDKVDARLPKPTRKSHFSDLEGSLSQIDERRASPINTRHKGDRRPMLAPGRAGSYRWGMRIATFNVNGIRAAGRRGFRDWLAASDADVVALQEVRCQVRDLPMDVFGGYHLTYDSGELAGRNGVAILTREPPTGCFGWSDDIVRVNASAPPVRQPSIFAREGRLIGVDLAGAGVTVVCVYVPKGGVPLAIAPVDGGREGYTPQQQDDRYKRKLAFLRRFTAEISARRAACEMAGRQLLVLGDLNIAHGPADLHNWRGNLASEGFLPAERAWLDATVGPAASSVRLDGRRILAPTVAWPAMIRPFVDVVRGLNPDVDGPYSWWSWQGQSFAKDVGWRIDYHLASPSLAATARRAWVDKAVSAEFRVSDHAPVVVDYAV